MVEPLILRKMKETKRTVSIEVNGKKVNIRFITDSEITKKIDEEGSLLCHYCKLIDLCSNEKLKNPFLLGDNSNNSSFHEFCVSGGIIGKYNSNSRISLGTIKKEYPELYEDVVTHYFEIPKYTTSKEISDDNDISILDLIIVGDTKFFDVMPSYEDVEPILDDLKI